MVIGIKHVLQDPTGKALRAQGGVMSKSDSLSAD